MPVWVITIVRKADDSIEVYNRRDGQTTHYVGEAAQEVIRLFEMMYETDDIEELGNLYGITVEVNK